MTRSRRSGFRCKCRSSRVARGSVSSGCRQTGSLTNHRSEQRNFRFAVNRSQAQNFMALRWDAIRQIREVRSSLWKTITVPLYISNRDARVKVSEAQNGKTRTLSLTAIAVVLCPAFPPTFPPTANYLVGRAPNGRHGHAGPISSCAQSTMEVQGGRLAYRLYDRSTAVGRAEL